MARLFVNIFVVFIIVTSGHCEEDDTDEDNSLVKLLAKQSNERHDPGPQHVDFIENNNNKGDFINDEISTSHTSTDQTSNQAPPLLTLLNLTQPTGSFGPDYKHGAEDGPTPKESEDDNAHKREEERYEETVGNPNPRPEYFQHVPDTLDFNHVNPKQEMEEGDEEKDGWKEIKNEYSYDNDGLANDQHLNNILENETQDGITAKQTDSESVNTKQNTAIKQFAGADVLPDIPTIEEEGTPEENKLGLRIKLLKNKIKLREKQNMMDLHHHKDFKNMTLSTPAKPKYVMKLLSNPVDKALNVQADKDVSIAQTILNNPKASNEMVFNQRVSSDLILRNLTSINVNSGKLGHRKELFAFSYDNASPFGPQSWQMLNPDWTCKGRKQSPINIDSKYIMDDQTVKNIMMKLTPNNIPITGIVKNNGHAPTLTLSNDITIKLFGGTLMNDYYLKQLHFHFGCDSSSGSEHHIDGIVYPLELHLVFWDNSTFVSFPDAAKADRGIAVISVLYQLEGMSYLESKESPLSQIVQVLHHIEEEGDEQVITEEFNFRLERLVPNVMNPDRVDRFFIYEGSLSTPGCYESVTWIVFATHPPITESQLESFRKLQSTKVTLGNKMCNNFRPVQKKNGRRIYSNIV